jgi:hypothetical protein
MSREGLINLVHLILREHGSTLYRRVKHSDIAIFEGEIPVGKIVDVIIGRLEDEYGELVDIR